MTRLARKPLLCLAAAVAGITPLTTLGSAQAATVLTLEGATTGADQPTTSWNEIMTGPICQQATTCTAVDYPSYDGLPGIFAGVEDLSEALAETDGDVVVFGYSNGATVGALWLMASTFDADRPDPDDVSFLLVGNVFRKHGGTLGFITALLPESQYQVTDVTRQYDWLSDSPTNPFNLVATANAALGYATVHINYHDIDLVDPSSNPGAVSWTEGNTTYVFVPTEDLPLLAPLRMLGMNDLADQLNDPLKVIVEDGYDRNLPETDGDPTGVAGHSTNYIPTNAVNVLNRAPGNEIRALLKLAGAVTDSDATDAAKLAALVNVLVPFPALSEPLGEELNSLGSTGQLNLLTPAISAFNNLTAPPSTEAAARESVTDPGFADRDSRRGSDASDSIESAHVPSVTNGAEADGAAPAQQAPAQDAADDDEGGLGRHRSGVPVRDLIHRVTGVSAGQDDDDDHQSPRRGLFGAPTAVRDQIRSVVSGGAASDDNGSDNNDADHASSDHRDSGNDSAGADE